jgi:hypothetical protein
VAVKEAANQLTESFLGVLEPRFTDHQGVQLVRPDGYVAYSSDRSDATGLNAVRSVLERQTVPSETTDQAA